MIEIQTGTRYDYSDPGDTERVPEARPMVEVVIDGIPFRADAQDARHRDQIVQRVTDELAGRHYSLVVRCTQALTNPTPIERSCVTCGKPEFPHNYRHPFKPHELRRG